MRLAVLIFSVLVTLTACAEESAEVGSTTTEQVKTKVTDVLETTPVQGATNTTQEKSKSSASLLLERFQEGVHYFELEESVPVDDPKKIEVAEMFWYGCSHCFAFEPSLVKWKKTKASDINFVRVPAMWNPMMEIHARMFYTAEKLGVLEDAHQALFNEIHINNKRLDKTEDIANILEKFGANKKEVINDLNSFEITSIVKKADVRARSYKIAGVPNIVVDGRYRIETNENVAQANMLPITDFLVEKVRSTKRK